MSDHRENDGTSGVRSVSGPQAEVATAQPEGGPGAELHPAEAAGAAGATGAAGVTTDEQDLLLALEPAHRFRCGSCGNVTRFDVTLSETTRRFHHFDLGGDHRIEEEEVLERAIRSVVCRWCGREDAISVEPAPVAGA